MNVLDLFSGIGGFSLGLERAGMRTVAFCEIDPFCRRVLAKHWPGVPCYDDVRTLTADRLRADGIAADVICGGFPCQDISLAGRGGGIEGERSGLWSEYARIIGELRPRYVVVENVAALLGRGLDRVLGDLAALGFDAEWHCIPAAAAGAPHRRDRVWIVANAHGEQCGLQQVDRPQCESAAELADDGATRALANTDQSRLERWISGGLQECASEWTARQSGSHLVNADCDETRCAEEPDGSQAWWRCQRLGERCRRRWHTWSSEPNVGRVADGVPARMDRLRGLGNAVVPQIPEIIGRAIMSTRAAVQNIHVETP